MIGTRRRGRPESHKPSSFPSRERRIMIRMEAGLRVGLKGPIRYQILYTMSTRRREENKNNQGC
eukprot:765214-Hanusia_phi.AAC.2